jgi:hypothetical protein
MNLGTSEIKLSLFDYFSFILFFFIDQIYNFRIVSQY